MANLAQLSLNNDASDVVDAYSKAETDNLVSGKMDLVSSPTADNVLITNASGQAVDSGFSVGMVSEPFRVKAWSDTALNTTIPTCTTDIANTQIGNMDFKISDEEGADYQIVGMIAYEVFDANNARINCWPVCQFTQNTQKTLRVRWMCGGTTQKVAKKITAWVLLKRR